MIDISKAETLLGKAVPGVAVLKKVEHSGKFVFLVDPPDSDEPPVLFAVDRKSGVVEDVLIWQLPDPKGLEQKLIGG